jgi:hypothetical protein
LLKLEKNVTFAHNIWPACLSSHTQQQVINLTVIGFGEKNTDDGSASDWLLKG